MDLHVYRNSQDRWRDLKAAARGRGAVLAINAVTLNELVERLTPDLTTATPGQRLALAAPSSGASLEASPWRARAAPRHPLPAGDGLAPRDVSRFANFSRYLYDALSLLKASRVRSRELRDAGADFLADALDRYDKALRDTGLCDPQDRCALAAARIREGAPPQITLSWLGRFRSVVLHALYDLTEAEFLVVRSLVEVLPEGGTVILFNTTSNVKATQLAEWTWQRFIQDESLAEKTYPDFCRLSQPTRPILEKLFDFQEHEPLERDDSLRIIEAPSRYKEVEKIGGEIADLLASGESPNDIVVVVRHIETYGEMLEDVFSRYGVPHRFETGVPLLRIPFIKYWLALLDLVGGDRSREAMARAMSSAYFNPRLSPEVDVERALANFGYLDRHHLRASALASRKNSPLTPAIERFEQFLDGLEQSVDTAAGFMQRLHPACPLNERDRRAWEVFAEEILAAGSVCARQDDAAPGSLAFDDFHRLVSEIAALRTVDRLSTSGAAPGMARVRVIHPDSLGSREHKWILAPGFADGEFPARSMSNPLLPDSVVGAINSRIRPRRIMAARDRNRREPLYLFMILDSATHRVTLTYPSSTLEGDPMYPSGYIGEIARRYQESPIVRSTPGPPRSAAEWRSRVAEEWRRGSLREDRLPVLLGEDIVARAKLEAKGVAHCRIDSSALSTNGVWHPSELNSLSSCPFVFLARHRLKLREVENPEFEVSNLEIGILAHAILRDFYSQPVSASVEEARRRMNDIIARRLSAADVNGQGPYSVFDPSLWRIRRRQLTSALNRYVDFAVSDALDGFRTLPEYLDAPLPPATLGETTIAGKPDRVAVRWDGPRMAAIRIDDFKYSAASGTIARQLKQSFQIPLYAFLAVRAVGADATVGIEGRYLLLRSPGNPVVSHPIDSDVFDEVRLRVEALVKKVHEGRLEPDPADRQSCAECDYRRLCRLYGG